MNGYKAQTPAGSSKPHLDARIDTWAQAARPIICARGYSKSKNSNFKMRAWTLLYKSKWLNIITIDFKFIYYNISI